MTGTEAQRFIRKANAEVAYQGINKILHSIDHDICPNCQHEKPEDCKVCRHMEFRTMVLHQHQYLKNMMECGY